MPKFLCDPQQVIPNGTMKTRTHAVLRPELYTSIPIMKTILISLLFTLTSPIPANAAPPVLAPKSGAPFGMNIVRDAVKIRLYKPGAYYQIYTAKAFNGVNPNVKMVCGVFNALEIEPTQYSFNYNGDSWFDVNSNTGDNRVRLIEAPEMISMLSQDGVATDLRVAEGRWAITDIRLVSGNPVNTGDLVRYQFELMCYKPSGLNSGGGILVLGTRTFNLDFPIHGNPMQSVTAGGAFATETIISPFDFYPTYVAGADSVGLKDLMQDIRSWIWGRDATFDLSGWTLEPSNSNPSPLAVRDAWDLAFRNISQHVSETSYGVRPLGYATGSGNDYSSKAIPYFNLGFAASNTANVTTLLSQMTTEGKGWKVLDMNYDLVFHAAPSPASGGGTGGDTTIPTVAFTSPSTNGTTVTNASLTVSGTASDNVGVASVSVRINGGTWNTATGTTSWSRSVTLAAGGNTIEAQARDAAGNLSAIASRTVTYNPLDTTIPTVAITSPTTNGTTVTASTMSVSGNASDNMGVTSVSVRINGGTWNIATGMATWSRSITLATGSNTIEAQARDAAGNVSAIAIRTVTYNPPDTTIPTVAIISPASNGTTMTTSSLTVSGTASDNTGVASVSVRINGGTWNTATGTTSWSRLITLVAGSNTIEAQSRDAAGNVSLSASRTVTYNPSDTTLPTVAFTSPASNGTTVTTSSLTVSGTASDNIGVASVSVRLNGGIWNTATGTTSWSRLVTLAAGSNTIEAQSRDAVGNISTISSRTVTYNPPDTTIPTVAFTSPSTNGTTVTNASLTVSGTASDNVGVASVSVRVNGGTWNTATGTTSWSRSVTLAAGGNTIEAQARDAAGNLSAIASRTITYNPPDTTIPTVAITSPASNGTTMTTSSLTVSGTASDNTGVASVSVRINGGTWNTATGTTSWNRLVALSAGSNTLEAQSRDATGNVSAIASRTVTYNPPDTTIPTVAITSPASNGTTMTTSSLTVSGTASDNTGVASVSVRINGGTWNTATGTTSWSRFITLVVGSNTIEAQSRDAAGNVSIIAIRTLNYSNPVSLPVIVQEPEWRYAGTGEMVAFEVVATGDNLSYQWFSGASGVTTMPIAGADGAILNIRAVADTYYWVRVTNPAGSVNSASVVLDIYSMPAGDTWQASTPVVTSTLWSVEWLGNQFVAVGDAGVILTSPTGENWTRQTSNTTQQLESVAWNGRMLVAVGAGGTIVTSPNRVNWTVRSNSGNELNAVIWNGTHFLATGPAGTMRRSADGISWQNVATNNANGYNLRYLNGLHVLVGPNTLQTSGDGVTWTTRISSSGMFFDDVTTNGLTWLATGSDGKVRTSSNSGATWTTAQTVATTWLRGVASDGAGFVAVGHEGVIYTSPNGTSWTARSAGVSGILHSIAWNGRWYVAVGENGVIVSSGGEWQGYATTNYSQWAASHGLHGALSSPAGDWDSDGVTNALEFIGGTSPTDPGDVWRPSPEIYTETGQKRVRMVFPRTIQSAALSLVLEKSSNGTNWTPVTLAASPDGTGFTSRYLWSSPLSIEGPRMLFRFRYPTAF